MIIKRGDKSYFIGLHWQQLYMKNKLQAEIATVIGKLRSPVGVVRPAPKGSSAQGQLGFTEDAGAKGSYSGAAVLANAIERGVLVELVGQDQYWVVMVLDHAVVAGTDRVFKEASVEEKVREFLGYAGSESVPIYMADAAAANLPMFENFEAIDFQELIEQATPDPHKNDVRISSLKKAPIGMIVGFVAMVGIAAGAYWSMNSGDQMASMASAIPAFTEKPVDDGVVELTDAMRVKARTEEAGWLLQRSALSPSFVLNALHQRFDQLPLSVSGWTLVSMTFDVADPSHATVTYRREVLGTPHGLSAALPLAWTFTDVADAATATVDLPSPMEAPAVDAVAVLNERNTRWLDFLDAVQGKGMEAKVLESLTHDRPTPVPGLPDGAPDAYKRQLHVTQHDFSVQGAEWLSADALLSALNKLDFIAVTAVTITFDNATMAWNLSGEVYEHAE